MSTASYEEQYREALVDLTELYELDSKSVGRKYGLKKQDDFAYFSHHWVPMYLRYVQVARRLDRVHDQMMHPQKRQDVRVVLDGCIARLLEMKRLIVANCGEHFSLDDALVDLKLTPEALEVPIPKYFVEDRANELGARRRFIESLFQLLHVDPKEFEPAPVAAEAPMTLERAIDIIQCSERGRQGRQRLKFLRTVWEQEQFQKADFEYGSTVVKEDAAKTIQRTVRGFLTRQRAQTELREELEFLGMEPSERILSNAARDKAQRALADRKMKQAGNLAELGQESRDMRTRIKLQEGGRMMEDMVDEVMLKLAETRLLTKDEPGAAPAMPQFPTEEEGGSLLLLGKLDLPTDEERAKQAAESAAAAAKKPAAAKETKKSDKELEEESLPVVPTSIFWDRFTGARDRYVKVWQSIYQRTYLEQKDFEQRFDADLLREEILDGPGSTVAELRKCVDQLITIEVANLRARMGDKTKPPKEVKPALPKGVKDPTEGKKLEEHMSRLVSCGALLLPTPTRLAEYIGEHTVMGSIMEQYDRSIAEQQDEFNQKWSQLLTRWNDYVEKSLRMTKEQFEQVFKRFLEQQSWHFEPSMQQVRQAVTEYAILPLGSQTVRDFVDGHTRGLLLFGPTKSGKTMLTHAICTEAGANLFCLSPAVINKEGINIPKLVQAVFRVARALAPSVIYIDEVEKVFASGKKKKEAGKSVKLRKDLLAQVRELEPYDRVLVIGNSRTPWDCKDDNDFKELFKKVVYCVPPDYASRLSMLRQRVRQRGAAFANDQDAEVLAYMPNKYASGTIAQVIDETVVPRRVKRISHRPLHPSEFIPALSRVQPIYRDDFELVKEFVGGLAVTTRKIKQDDLKEAEVDPKAKGGAKPKAKK